MRCRRSGRAINALLGKEELTDDERSELDTLTKRAQEIEVELRAALVVDGESEERARAAFDGTPATTPEATPEARELERITAAASVADIVHAAVEKRATDGATAELQKHLGISGDQVPLELLETRAATHTPAPTDGEPNAQQFVPAVFPQGSIAAFLGIAQPTVAVGHFVVSRLDHEPDRECSCGRGGRREFGGRVHEC